jgi:hypothetical protein
MWPVKPLVETVFNASDDGLHAAAMPALVDVEVDAAVVDGLDVEEVDVDEVELEVEAVVDVVVVDFAVL